jgi:hypothetical protein
MKRRWDMRLRYTDESNSTMHGDDVRVHLQFDKEPGRYIHLVLNQSEVAKLRDELTRWLEYVAGLDND